MKRVAVVEDNPDNRLLLEAILQSHYDVTLYDRASAALDGLRAAKADLVFMDLSLPGMDGFELLRHLRADPELRTIPVIAITAHAMSGDRQRCLDAGFNDYMAKPILDEKALLVMVARLLAP
jgi:CheY-like chemotaxis protein